MEKLSSYLNRKFTKTIVWTFLISVLLAVISITFWSYLKAKHDLGQLLGQSSSLVTSLIFDRNWSLINEHFDVLSDKASMTYIEIIQKSDSSLIFQSSYRHLSFIPSICLEDSSSPLIRLKACSQIISNDILLMANFLILGFIIIFCFVYLRLKKQIIENVNELSQNVYDIIEENNVENGLKKSKIDEFENIKMILNMKTEEIKKVSKEAAFIDVSRKIAHDLRSPVMTIENILSLKTLSENDIEILLKCSRNLRLIASNFLKETKDNSYPENVRYDISRKLEELFILKTKEYDNLLGSQPFTLELYTNELLWVPENDFDRMISNLINNSFEICGNSLQMLFTTIIDSEFFVLTVEDNGPGFEEQFIQYFYSGTIKSSKPQGFGIGLRSAVDFVHSLGGKLDILNNHQGSAKIIIKIPSSRTIRAGDPLILIENDKYVRLSWLQVAKERGYNLLTFSNISNFESNLSLINPGSEIFIDSELDEGIKGEEYIFKLLELGFNKVNIQTGKLSSDFPTIKNLNSIISKKFPYD